MDRLAVDLQKTAQWGAIVLYLGTAIFLGLGLLINRLFFIGFIILGLLSAYNLYLKHVQKNHTLLRNFGILGQARYILESIGPELRQYFYANDIEERPFNRKERAEVYQKAKDIDSTTSFGSQLEFNDSEIKLRHSMFSSKKHTHGYSLTFGDARDCKNTYTITKPMIISAMSYGSLGKNAVTALSKGAKLAGIPMNTGEGGLSPYHVKGGADLIYQMGTAKFGCRNEDGTLNDEKLKDIAKNPRVKMVEIKISQGAKPGKGGLLPKEKITEEIAKIRGVPMDQDVKSPPRHPECDTPENFVKFIKRVQDVSELPVGFKFCMGKPEEIREIIQEMKKQNVYPDYIALDGSEGGTGAAPKSFMDHMGMPLFPALNTLNEMLILEGVRNKIKILASGKLINAGKQIAAIAHGADAIYTARGFMFSLGCIQALQCNKGTCPAGIATHDEKLQRGLDIDEKAKRVANYVKNSEKDFKELLQAMGCPSLRELTKEHVYMPTSKITS